MNHIVKLKSVPTTLLLFVAIIFILITGCTPIQNPQPIIFNEIAGEANNSVLQDLIEERVEMVREVIKEVISVPDINLTLEEPIPRPATTEQIFVEMTPAERERVLSEYIVNLLLALEVTNGRLRKLAKWRFEKMSK